jgi:hypothetical protein
VYPKSHWIKTLALSSLNNARQLLDLKTIAGGKMDRFLNDDEKPLRKQGLKSNQGRPPRALSRSFSFKGNHCAIIGNKLYSIIGIHR